MSSACASHSGLRGVYLHLYVVFSSHAHTRARACVKMQLGWRSVEQQVLKVKESSLQMKNAEVCLFVYLLIFAFPCCPPFDVCLCVLVCAHAFPSMHPLCMYMYDTCAHFPRRAQNRPQSEPDGTQRMRTQNILSKLRGEVSNLQSEAQQLRQEHSDLSTRCTQLDATRLRSLAKVLLARTKAVNGPASVPK